MIRRLTLVARLSLARGRGDQHIRGARVSLMSGALEAAKAAGIERRKASISRLPPRPRASDRPRPAVTVEGKLE